MKNSSIIRTLLVIISIVGAVNLNSCKHEPLVPKGSNDNGDGDGDGTGIPCDPNIVYFNQQILPILVSSCAKSGCHDAASAQDGVILNTYSNVMATGDVRPFDLSGSDLWEVITDSDPDDRMPPQGESPLTAAQINLITLWINQGAQNLVCDDNLGPCDSTNVTYTAGVRPILLNKCVGCHTSATPSNNNVNLSNYSGVATVAANGKLVGTVKHLQGFIAMPKNGPKLNDCEISKIVNWVSSGYPNN